MAVIKSFDLKEFSKLFGDKKYGKAIFLKKNRKMVFKAVNDALLKSIQPMAERSPVDTGLYASAWTVEKQGEEQIFFGNTAPYAFHVEKGTEPFKPPYKPIAQWSARKLQLPESHPQVKKMTYFVIKKIEKEGITPKHVLEKGLDDVIIPKIKRFIAHYLDNLKNKDWKKENPNEKL